jgi:hypothetical protein
MFGFFNRKDQEKKEIISKITNLDSVMKHSFTNVKKDVSKVSGWVKYFKSNEEKQNKHIKELSKKIEKLTMAFEEFKELYEEAPEPPKERSIDRSIVHERVQSFNRSDQSFMNDQFDHSKVRGKLTPAHKKIIRVLMVASRPIDYETIAKELKLSVVTVRRHINDIKRIGFEINAKMSVDTNRKVFFIEKEVKKSVLEKK